MGDRAKRMDSRQLDAFVEDVDDSLEIDEAPQEVEEEAQTAPEPEPPPAEDETGETQSATPAESEEEEPQDFDSDDPAEKTPEARRGLRKALAEKTEKWRTRERALLEEVARLRGQTEVYQQSGPARPESQPEANKDDDFYNLGPSTYIDQQLEARDQKQKVALSAQIMRSLHEDFDEHVNEFLELVQRDPSLEVRALSSDNPAKFAYDYAKINRETQEIGSPEEWKAKTRAELRKEVEAELRRERTQASAAEATTSSASASGAGVTSPVTVSSVDDMDFDEMLKGVNNR